MERALQADLFREEKERREDFLKIAREQSLEESENKEKIQSQRENKVERGLLYTELCFYVQKVSFLWFQRVFPQTERQVFHNIMEV